MQRAGLLLTGVRRVPDPFTRSTFKGTAKVYSSIAAVARPTSYSGWTSAITVAATALALPVTVALSEDSGIPKGVDASKEFTPVVPRHTDTTQLGDAYVWGDNTNGLVPGQEQITVAGPSEIAFFKGRQFKSISASATHAAAVDDKGNVYRWGRGFAEGPQPKLVLAGSSACQVVCGATDCYALTESGYLLRLGKSTEKTTIVEKAGGILGLVGSSAQTELTGVAEQLKLPAGFENERIVKIAAGEHHLVAITKSGKVFSAAQSDQGNAQGQLGLGHLERAQPNVLHHVPFSGAVRDVSCGFTHSLLLAEDGLAFAFGSNKALQLCQGPYKESREVVPRPLPVVGLPSTMRVTQVSAGGDNSAFVTEDNSTCQLYVVGFGQFGQLGNGMWTHLSGEPVKVRSLSDKIFYDEKTKKLSPIRVKSVSCGARHLAAVLDTQYADTVNGHGGLDVYTWGYNKDCQLGHGSRISSAVPKSALSLVDPGCTMRLSWNHHELVQRIVCGPDVTFVVTEKRTNNSKTSK